MKNVSNALSPSPMKRVDFEQVLIDLKLRPADLARIVGVTPTTVSLWGKIDPSTGRVRPIPLMLVVLLESWMALKQAGIDYPVPARFPRDSKASLRSTTVDDEIR